MRPILASTLMLSSIFLPAAAVHASTIADDAAAKTPDVRVSTGVTAPKLLKHISIPMPEGIANAFVPTDSQLELTFTVDAKGQAENVKVIKSINPYWDARVVDEIKNSQFTPAKLDNQSVPMDMNLTVKLER